MLIVQGPAAHARPGAFQDYGERSPLAAVQEANAMYTRPSRRALVVAAAAGGLVSAALGTGALAQTQPNTINVSEKEFAVTTSAVSASAAQVTFQVTNQGAVGHELVLMRTDLAPEALALDGSGAKVEEDAATQKDVGEVEDVAPGETKSATFDLTPGRYVLICNLPGHYQAGMRAAFTIQADGGDPSSGQAAGSAAGGSGLTAAEVPATLPNAGDTPNSYPLVPSALAAGLAILVGSAVLRFRLARGR